jgi:hypothetical protein
MDVSFRINRTSSLEDLEVTATKPRTYSSKVSASLWAVEDTGLKIGDAAPFWAIVDDKYESAPHLWTMRKDHLYISVGFSGGGYLESVDASASARASHQVLHKAYHVESASTDGIADYSGITNYALFLKWQELVQKPDIAVIILNLIWTDIMANYVVSTRSVDKDALVRVRRFDRKIQYDMRYVIPAIVFLSLYVMIMGYAFVIWLLGRVRFQHLRTLLNQTATGRIVTVERYGEAARAPAVSTKEWVRKFGEEDIEIRKDLAEKKDGENICASSPALSPGNDDIVSSTTGQNHEIPSSAM